MIYSGISRKSKRKMAKGQVYVVDTHVLIWYFIGSKRLEQKLKNRIDEVRNQGGCLLVPTIVLAEALDIAEKGKVKFDFTKMHRLIIEEPEFEVVGFWSRDSGGSNPY